ncbi:hypothetical protein MY5147_003677 [Beauveria neobassiana]
MHSINVSLVSTLVAALAATVNAENDASQFDAKHFNSGDIIQRDVAIIGGGAAGTYSAISLKDKGKSVIVIEKKDRLGGHTETYIDPATGTPMDLGVMIWHNISVVNDYFGRFGIPLAKAGAFFTSSEFFDFRTGKEIKRSWNPTDAQVLAAFAAYSEQRDKYPKLINGTFLPSPVPEDLYMPFGDFVKKYKVEAAVTNMFNYNPGVGNILKNPTVEQYRYWGYNMVHSRLTGFLTTARHNSSELYTKAGAELTASSSLLLNSQVSAALRGEGKTGVLLVVSTPSGKKLVVAKKLLVAIPPKLDFMGPLDLDHREKNLFGKFISTGYYVGIVKNAGFYSNASITNAIQDAEYNLPQLPAAYSFAPAPLPGHQMVTYATPQGHKSLPMSDDKVKADIISTIKRLQRQNPGKFKPQGEPEFVDFRCHAPYVLQVSARDIKDEFYKKLYALQGLRNTYWTGAAWKAQDSSLLWKFSEEIVLPPLIAGL